MSDRSKRFYAPTVLAASLAFNIVFVSCGADATAPTIAQEAPSAEVLAALLAMSERLDSIEARTARIDQNTSDGIQAIVTQLSDPEGAFMDALSIGLNTSLGTSMEVCVNLESGFGFGYEAGVSGEGELEGMVGPNAVEAWLMGGGELQVVGDVSAGRGLEGAVALALCGEAGSALDASIDVLALLDASRAAISSLGIDGNQLQALASAAGTPFDASYSGVVSNATAALPVPMSLQSKLNDPLSLLSSSPEILAFGVENRCNPAIFASEPVLSTTQSRLCALEMPSTEAYVDILNGLDGLPGTVNALGSSLASACGALGVIVPARLVIPSQSITVAGQNFQTFPGIDRRLFPGLSVDC